MVDNFIPHRPSLVDEVISIVLENQVNLLNHGTKIITDQAERYGAAAINLEAGLKAVSLAAFPDAQARIDFLEGGDFWNEQYILSLNLYSTDAKLGNQNFDLVTELR
jgi:hypothetical protein